MWSLITIENDSQLCGFCVLLSVVTRGETYRIDCPTTIDPVQLLSNRCKAATIQSYQIFKVFENDRRPGWLNWLFLAMFIWSSWQLAGFWINQLHG